MHPDRVVVGADAGDEEAADAVAALYEPLGEEGEILRTDVASAEMIKLASNAFLATKISFINEIANVCEEVGADVGEVARGMGADTRIGSSFLRAGIGYGGSCFPKDVSALKMLAGNTGYHFQLLTSVIEVNELQKRRVVGKLEKHLGSLIGKRVALLGLAFKPDTDDMREASSLVLAARLQGEGAEVVAYDPVAAERASEMLTSVEMADSAMAALEGADAAVLVTEWGEFRELDWAAAAAAMARPLIVDGRNFLDPAALAAAGFEYEGIGRQARRRRSLGRQPVEAAMQAIVLVGGEGTRLRPLTDTVPKPALTLVDRPFLAYMIEWLGAHGVTEVVLACGFLPDRLREALGDGEHGGVRLDLRGRARAARHRGGDPLRRRSARRPARGPLPRPERRRPHRPRPDRAAALARGARGAGDDRPLRGRGLLRLRPGRAATPAGAVLDFTEKTGEAVPGEINAGAYVLERSVLDLIPPGREVSIEREVFPRLVGEGCARCRWMGTGWTSAPPSDTCRRPGTSSRGGWRPPCARPRRGSSSAPAARSPTSARIGPRAVRLGRAARSAAGAEVAGSVLLEGCTVGERARGSAARSSPPGAVVEPGAQVADAMVAEHERVGGASDDRRRPRHSRPASRRALADRIGAPRGGARRRASSSAGWAARRSAATSPRRRSATG